ncbi:DegT/DnrJ/EryC1/StrS family aminotransferase [Candidatus Woesearchaeota archaeon]|nr:DegT/DnrJ/EryC1/StrS family aminotransferase [Candidatus Woesearchaeota archaeon]
MRKVNLVRPKLHDFNLFCERAKSAFESGLLTNNGPFAQEFEAKASAYMSTPTLAFSNGTYPITMVLQGLGCTKGEIIIPSFTFVASAHAAVAAGLTPVFVDVDKETYTLDPVAVEKAITSKTVAIMGVHVFGNPCDIDALQRIADKHKVPLIFDAAHAFGSTYKGKKIGGFGAAETFSTHATKTLISVEGGLVSTHHPALIEYLKKARNFGLYNAYDSEFIGTNAKMSELHAIVGLDSLAHIDEAVAAKQHVVSLYKKYLANVSGVHFQREQRDSFNANFFFSIIIDAAKFGMDRDQLAEELEKQGVMVRKYFFKPLHQHLSYREWNSVSLPNTEWIANNILCLPTHTSLTDDDVEYVCEKIRCCSK